MQPPCFEKHPMDSGDRCRFPSNNQQMNISGIKPAVVMALIHVFSFKPGKSGTLEIIWIPQFGHLLGRTSPDQVPQTRHIRRDAMKLSENAPCSPSGFCPGGCPYSLLRLALNQPALSPTPTFASCCTSTYDSPSESAGILICFSANTPPVELSTTCQRLSSFELACKLRVASFCCW